MKKIILTGILIACFISGFGQKIRTLNEILTIIEKSEIEYDLYEMIVKAYPENYTPAVSIVAYKQLDTDKDYEMHEGLFFSKKEGDILVPDFGCVVMEKVA